MSKLIDLTGQEFGDLVVIRYDPRKTKHAGTYWLCRCSCGRLLLARSDNLRSGRTNRCSECRNNAGVPSVFVKG